MISGALMQIPENFDIEILDEVRWERIERGLPIRSVIQLQGQFLVENGVAAREGLAIHQEIKRVPELHVEGGRYSITYVDNIQTNFSVIYALPGLIVTDKLKNREFVRDTINKGLREANLAQYVLLDTSQMAMDHRDQWIRGFADRRGRVDRGTVYGYGVEQDSVFGPELRKSSSKSVGWTTGFFGSLDKLRVSPRGSVTLWANPPIELFLRFLRYEILPYVIALP